jgi:carbohydrate-selective porin OprB
VQRTHSGGGDVAAELSPNVQYISDPGGVSANKNVWVLGLKAELSL